MLFTKYALPMAFCLPLVAPAPSLWSTAAPVTNFPILPRMANQSTTGQSPASGTKKYFAEALCTPDQKLVEQVAWSDALQYAQALASWQPNGNFQPAMDLYMGNDSRGPLGATLRANIDGAVKVHNVSTWPEKQRLFIFCTEPTLFVEVFGEECGQQGTVAYEFDINGTYYENHYVVFCPVYYKQPSLSESLSLTDAVPAERLVGLPADRFVGNQAEFYFHESLHLADLTTPVDHPIADSNGNESSKYGPYGVAREAKLKNTAACLHIADAYACAAAAILAQQRYNLADPPKPWRSFSRRNFGSQANSRKDAIRHLPQLPNPNTTDNRIISNDFGIGPVASVVLDRPKSGSTSLLKRVAWPPTFSCTPENGCTRSMAARVATTISGPLICFLVVGLCVLSFFL